MDSNTVNAIAKTLGEDAANESVQVTLPGAAVAYLLRWAEVGLEKADADSDVAVLLGAISAAVDAEVVRTSDQFVSVEEFLARFDADATAAGRPTSEDDAFDHAGVWDANGKSQIGGPDLR